MESPSWPLPLGEVLGIYVLLFYNCFCFLVSAFLWLGLNRSFSFGLDLSFGFNLSLGLDLGFGLNLSFGL